MTDVARPRGPFALRICGGCGEQINDGHHMHRDATGAVYDVPAITLEEHEAALPEQGCAWLLWGDYTPTGTTKPLGAYRTRETALAAERLAKEHPNAHLWSDFRVTPWPLADEPVSNFRMEITPSSVQEPKDAAASVFTAPADPAALHGKEPL